MKHIKKKELEKLKKQLLDQRKTILEHLGKIEQSASLSGNNTSGDEADIANMEISQAALTKLGTREKKLLSKINYSLEKFNDDSYGICELTGEPIPVKRLFARPVAQYTVEAKEELERREKGFSSDDEDWDLDFE